MNELTRAIPDCEVLLALEPEELGAKILFLLRKQSPPMGMFNLSNAIGQFWSISHIPGQQFPYPVNRRAEIELAMTEAWAWLEAQGLLIPAGDTNGRNGWRVLSRRAKSFENEQEFARYEIARTFPKNALHARIAKTVWMALMRQEFDVAVFQAMKAVEVAVREASGLGNDLVGVKLMRDAFHPQNGPLTEQTAESGEKVARMELFAGAIGSYKNPHSHRDLNLNDPAEAIEIILFANHLLRIVDHRRSDSSRS